MKVNYFNAEHTHALIDLPTNLTIEQVIQKYGLEWRDEETVETVK